MSLDVYLESDLHQVECHCARCGNKHTTEEVTTYFEYNITHNLNTMAEKAGIYKYLWRPEELGITKAKELIDHLEIGLAKLKENPEYFKVFNPKNEWGNYSNLVDFVQDYLQACKQFPEANVRVSR